MKEVPNNEISEETVPIPEEIWLNHKTCGI